MSAMTAVRTERFGLWIDGKSRRADSGATFERTSPFDGSVAARFANGNDRDATAAIEAARTAFDGGRWARSSARARYEVLRRAAQILADNANAVAERMARESGKPIKTGLGEVGVAVRTLEYYAGAALDLEGSAVSERVHEALGLILHEPVGVCGFITPWNFPILNPVVKIAPALAVGCTIVIKPSHLCSGPMLLLADYLSEAGLPDGVFNVVTSDLDRGAVVGQTIAASPLVDKVAFTGSTATGRAVMRTAAGTNKRVSMELGGKSANIVFADAPFDEAAATAVNAFCFNSGQQCSAGTRLLVQREIHDRFVEAMIQETKKQVVGDPMKDATTMGPIINADQFKRVQSFLEIGRRDARLIVGGGAPAGAMFADSLFVAPTIFDGVDNASRLAQEEIFGPVLSVIPFDTEEDAIRIANDTHYGLAGGVWTGSIDKAIRVVKAVRTGKMFVNCYNNSGLEDLPHGGYKDSGIGREQGRLGLADFQEVKTVQIRIGPPPTGKGDVPAA
jgi:acyl-CoA reductase-like NAD-dependent aldehyde dehydrogenase